MAKPLRKKGLPLFNDIAELVDGVRATALNAFEAGQPTSGPSAQNAVSSAATSYEPGSISNEEMDRDSPLDNSSLNITANALRRTFSESEIESLYSSDDECTDTQSYKGKSVRKRTAGPSNMGNERHKMHRISVEQGIAAVACSMETGVNSLKDIITGVVQRTTHPSSEALGIEAKAMEAIEIDEGFSDEDIKNAALVITNNPNIANMYLLLRNMRNKAVGTEYLLRHMEQIKGDY